MTPTDLTPAWRWLAHLALFVTWLSGCSSTSGSHGSRDADDETGLDVGFDTSPDADGLPQPIRIRPYSSDGPGFPAAVQGQLVDVRLRTYRGDREQDSRIVDPDGLAPSWTVDLSPGASHQVVVEGLDLDGQSIADGATPVFDLSEASDLDEIRVFVSPLHGVEYASALYVFGSELVSAPSVFEGPFVAQASALDPETYGGQRAGHSATALSDGRIVVIGGARLTSGSGIGGSPFAHFVDTVEIYDPLTGYWSILRRSDEGPLRLSVPRAFHTATRLGGDRILVAGGFAELDGRIEASAAAEIVDVDTASVEVMDPGVTDMLEPRALHSAHYIAPTAGQPMVVMVGGVGRQFDRPAFLSSIEAYDVERGFFDRVVDAEDPGEGALSLATGRGLHAGVTLPDGILVTGGRTDEGVTATVELLEIHQGGLRRMFPQGTQLPSLATARFGHAALLMEQAYDSAHAGQTFVAIAGGFTGFDPDGDAAFALLEGLAPTASIELLDTATLAVAPELQLNMATARAHFGMVETTITRDLMVFGGVTAGGVTDGVERFLRTVDGGFPLTSTTVESGLNDPRAFMPALNLETHNAMVIGGWDGGSSATPCTSGGTPPTGCTSELANPGDLFHLGYLY